MPRSVGPFMAREKWEELRAMPGQIMLTTALSDPEGRARKSGVLVWFWLLGLPSVSAMAPSLSLRLVRGGTNVGSRLTFPTRTQWALRAAIPALSHSHPCRGTKLQAWPGSVQGPIFAGPKGSRDPVEFRWGSLEGAMLQGRFRYISLPSSYSSSPQPRTVFVSFLFRFSITSITHPQSYGSAA